MMCDEAVFSSLAVCVCLCVCPKPPSASLKPPWNAHVSICSQFQRLMDRQTAKMISEAALCLVYDKDKLPAAVGILTPSVGLGGALIARLQARGMDFFFEDAPYVP